MKFVVKQSEKDGQWYWHLVARNGKTIADGSEGYASAGNCRKAVKRVMNSVLTATLVA